MKYTYILELWDIVSRDLRMLCSKLQRWLQLLGVVRG